MHLSYFGLIALDGTVNKPEPGLDFAGYQLAMAHYSATMALRSRLKNRGRPDALENRATAIGSPEDCTAIHAPQEPAAIEPQHVTQPVNQDVKQQGRRPYTHGV